MNILILKQLNYIIKNNIITDIYIIDRIRYGLEVLNYEVIKLIIILSLFIYLDKISNLFVIFYFTITIRTLTGGGHAKSQISCLFTSIVILVSTTILSSYLPPLNIISQLIIILPIIYFYLSKQFISKYKRAKKNSQTIKRNKIIVIISIVAWLIFSNLFLSYHLINCGLIYLIFLSSDLLLEVRKNEKKYQYESI